MDAKAWVGGMGNLLLVLWGWAPHVWAQADEPGAIPAEQVLAEGQDYRLMLEGGMRWQQGTAREIVYTGSLVLSDLTWDIKDLLFVGATLQLDVWQQLALGVSYWEAVTEGNGGMTDYDYFIPGIWTDFSDGPVDINRANMLDVYAEWAFALPRAAHLRLIGGYRRLYWDWSQYGGSFIYSEDGFRDFRGDFPADQNGINYEQTFHIPYVGLGLRTRWRGWNFSTYVQYSAVAWAEALDEHVLRELLFEDSFQDVKYYAAGVSLAYRLGPRWHVGGAWDWHDIPEARGDARITDQVTGTAETIRDAGGIANRAWSLSLSSGIYF